MPRAIGWPQSAVLAAVVLLLVVSAGAEGLGSSEVTARSVTLAWTAVGDDALDGSAAKYDIRYATSAISDGNFEAAAAATNIPVPLPAGSLEFFEVTGLEPSTQYFFAIRVGDDGDNWSGLSNVISRTTTSGLSAITDLEARTGFGSGQIDLTWTDPPETVDTSSFRRYLIRYAEGVFDGNSLASVLTVDTVLPAPASGRSQVMTLTGLVPGLRYYLAVQVFDGFVGWSPLSEVATATASSDITTGVAESNADRLPTAFEVRQNYPNPFNPTTTISYTLPRQMHVRVDIYDALGRRVVRVIDAVRPAGDHRVEWNALNGSGDRVSSGVYFYRVEAGGAVSSRKMILLK